MPPCSMILSISPVLFNNLVCLMSLTIQSLLSLNIFLGSNTFSIFQESSSLEILLKILFCFIGFTIPMMKFFTISFANLFLIIRGETVSSFKSCSMFASQDKKYQLILQNKLTLIYQVWTLLTIHIIGVLINSDVIPQTLAHLFNTISPLNKWQSNNNLWFLAIFSLHVPTYQ